jgi:hypothetical protein
MNTKNIKTTQKLEIAKELLMAVSVMALVVGSLTALTAMAATCPNQATSFSNENKPCRTADCLTATNPGVTCSYSQADQYVFCDCTTTNSKCQATSVKVKNFLLITLTGDCGAGGSCINASTNSYSTNTEGTIQETIGCD